MHFDLRHKYIYILYAAASNKEEGCGRGVGGGQRGEGERDQEGSSSDTSAVHRAHKGAQDEGILGPRGRIQTSFERQAVNAPREGDREEELQLPLG